MVVYDDNFTLYKMLVKDLKEVEGQTRGHGLPLIQPPLGK